MEAVTKQGGVDERAPVRLRPAHAGDLGGVLGLLSAEQLPTAGVAAAIGSFVVAEAAGRIVGAAGTEAYGSDVLLRSVVVHADWKGRGMGGTLVTRALEIASAGGASDVYLLTTTADGWFPRLGFDVIERADVPAAVRASVEFAEACPASAIVMHRRLAD